jgi:uncharacterized protein
VTRYLDHPFHLDGGGRVAATSVDDHVRALIHQVLFTNPGERVNRPDFGCGLLQLAFMPNGDLLAGATEFLIQGALQRWLVDVIEVIEVRVIDIEERLEITVTYQRVDDRQSRTDTFITPALPGAGGGAP